MKYLSYFFQEFFTLYFIFLVLYYYINFFSISLVYFAPLSVSLCLESFIFNFLIGQHLYLSNGWLRDSWAMNVGFVCEQLCREEVLRVGWGGGGPRTEGRPLERAAQGCRCVESDGAAAMLVP